MAPQQFILKLKLIGIDVGEPIINIPNTTFQAVGSRWVIESDVA